MSTEPRRLQHRGGGPGTETPSRGPRGERGGGGGESEGELRESTTRSAWSGRTRKNTLYYAIKIGALNSYYTNTTSNFKLIFNGGSEINP